ncbi:amidohydrolase [Natronoglomus mannanivorans]|uniref:Amidohydrolase n=1 Tax=Natronoglomus mannanivorans TaxID=2979990 RepID=A0AAP3E3E7_9EURY|nr:amidohydrolase [Halobacteria archaeon AArc-xg1-1]
MTTESLLLHNGPIHILDDAGSIVNAIRFENGVVDAVGADALNDADVTERIDLDGCTVLPGFNDAHTHILSVGLTIHETDLETTDNRREALELLGENAERTDSGDWVLGFGYDESTWPVSDREYLTRDELDAVSDEHPIAAQRIDGHTITLNSAGQDRVDFDGVEHDLRRDERGELTGVVVEDAAIRVKKATYPDREKARTALELGVRRANELGLTSIQDMAGMTTPTGDGDPAHAAFFAAWRDDDLPIRLGYYVHVDRGDDLSNLEIASGFGDDRLRILGLKVFADGAIGSQTAKLTGEFHDDPGNDGQFVIGRERLTKAFAGAARANQQIATHAIGDEAIDVVLDAYEDVLEEYTVPEPRLRIEHVELATDEQIERMADLGIVASMQPNFVQWSKPNGLYETRLGRQWRRRNNRHGVVLEEGVPLAFGSDKMPFGPLYGIHHAVNAPHDAQRLSVEEAIRAYTQGGAYAEHAEDRKGTLERGMLADAVILDRDPFEHPENIVNIDVRATIIGGEFVYEAPSSVSDHRGRVHSEF